MDSIEQYAYTNSRGRTYYLNSKVVNLKSNGFQQRIFFFTKDLRETSCSLPEGYIVREAAKNGLPVVSKEK